MRKIIDWLNDSKYINSLSPACKMCAKGSKMVLLLTGLCPSNCFYCPLSFEKLGKDRIYADEWELENEKDTDKLISEAKYIDAEGAGFTGGDPLIVWERTKKYIELLKKNFSTNFHIHLYTSGLKNYQKIPDLAKVGLDEIRFHPNLKDYNKMENSQVKKAIDIALDSDIDVAIEIPVLPSKEKEIIDLITWADKKGINWINLNELEFSETNADALINKKYDVKDDISSAVKGSEKTAYNVLKFFEKKNICIGLHYCSSSFKDGIQLRNRILRRAKNVSKTYEKITEDGTLLKGIILVKSDPETFVKKLKQKYHPGSIFHNKEKNRIETSVEIVREISNDKKLECFIIEEYPTADRLEVERIPL